MTHAQRHLWELVQIPPQKWVQHPWGDEGNGFWVVAIIGFRCLYFNDIEDGYNWSSYAIWGVIDEYWCDQDELPVAIHRLLNNIQGQENSSRIGSPQSIPSSDA